MSNGTYYSSSDCKMEDIKELNRTASLSNSSSKIIYESRFSTNTLTEKYGLVCEKSWLISLTKSYISLGTAIGCLIVGRFTERFGRRRITIILLVLIFFSNLCIQFSNSFVLFSIACLVNGISIMPGYSVCVIQVLENVSNSRRPFLGSLGRYGLSVGQAVLAGVSWALQDWYYIQIFQTAFAGSCIPLCWYIIDSPCWLVVKGRPDDAKKNIMIIAKRNGRDLVEAATKADLWILATKEECAKSQSTAKGRFVDLFQNRVIIKYTFLMAFVAMFTSLCLCGVFYNIETFGTGLYQDFLYSCGLSAAGIIIISIVLTKYSIRQVERAGFSLTVMLCVIYIFTTNINTARTILSALIRGTLTACSSTLMPYVAELLPTSVRVVGSAVVIFFTTFSAGVSPFVKELGERTHTYVPFILFAVVLFGNVVMLCFLPDTKDKPLVHNVEDLIKKKETKNETMLSTVESK